MDVTPYLAKQTVSGLFDMWDDVLRRVMSALQSYGCEQYVGMSLLADTFSSQLIFYGINREDVKKRLTLSPFRHRSEHVVIVGYHYLAGRVFMANVPYCMDAPTVAFVRANGGYRRWCGRRSYAMDSSVRWKWELSVFAAIGRSGDLYALPYGA